MIGAIKMIFNRIINKLSNGNKYKYNYRYFEVRQDDGLVYQMELEKDNMITQVGAWVRDGISFIEISAKDFYGKDFKQYSLK